MQLAQKLEDIVSNIQINSEELYIHHRSFPSIKPAVTTLEQLQKLPKIIQVNYLNLHLLKLIYSIYFEGSCKTKTNLDLKTNSEILQEIAAQEIDWEFYAQLDDNNKGTGWFHPGFQVIKEESDSRLAVEFDNLILQIQRERHLPLSLQTATVNDAVAILLPSSYISGFRYLANGDCLGGLPPVKAWHYTLLIYFNFSPKAAVSAMKHITTKLNAMKLSFSFDVLHNPLNYSFYNSGVLKVFSEKYDPELYKKFILPVLQPIYTENQSQFRAEIPIFTKKIAPGIGLAERPNREIKLRNLLDSEGNYCEFVADALLEAHHNNEDYAENRIKYILRKFEKYGIDIERPYLNPNAEDIYAPLV